MKLTSALFPASNRALATLTVVSFLLAAVGRFAFIGLTPMSESFIDLVIYMSGGRIVSHGLNPYDSTDGSEFRRKLRAEYAQAQPWLTETQERFDFYASGNLPLNLMFFGAIEHFLPGNPYAYRAAFALADSLLSAVVVCFVFRVWRAAPSAANLLLAAGLGVFSPILFFCGVLQPEDKGLEILLLLSAVCFAWSRRWVLSAFLLAASIAYKGVGVFIAPLCLWYTAARPGCFREWLNRPALARCAAYAGIVTVAVTVTFLPYPNGLLPMITHRLSANVGLEHPQLASIWRPVDAILPGHWKAVETVFIVLFIVLNLVGVLRKRFGPEVITASLLVLFLDVFLLQGALNRLNIGLLSAIVIIGAADLPFALRLGAGYVAGSVLYLLPWMLWAARHWVAPLISGAALGPSPGKPDSSLIGSYFALALVIWMTALLAAKAAGGAKISVVSPK